MRVCVVGCGAVGSLFAANLAQLDDVEAWAYDLARDHVDAINANGLRLSGAGDVVGRLRATADAEELPACDFGIVATKAMHTEPAIAATAHAFVDGSVCTVQLMNITIPIIKKIAAKNQRNILRNRFIQPCKYNRPSGSSLCVQNRRAASLVSFSSC